MSTIRMFKGCKLQPQHNFIVDEFEYYLSTLEYIDFLKVPFLRPQVTQTIKLPLNSFQLSDFITFEDSYNYLRYELNGRYYYYYILSRDWNSASSTISLNCQLDVLNSFKEGEDYNFTKRTHIKRRHFERFQSRRVDSISYHYRRLIHPENEGINFTPYSSSSDLIEDIGILNQDFYLVVKSNVNQESADLGKIQVFISTGNITTFKLKDELFDLSNSEQYDFVLSGNNFTTNVFWFFKNDYNFYYDEDNNSYYFIINNNRYTVTHDGIAVYFDGASFVVADVSRKTDSVTDDESYIRDSILFRALNDASELYIDGVQKGYMTNNSGRTYAYDPAQPYPVYINSDDRKLNLNNANEKFFNSVRTELNSIITSIDRTSAGIDSIILLPYSPNDFNVIDNKIVIDVNNSNFIFNLREQQIELLNLDYKFSHSVKLPASALNELEFSTLVVEHNSIINATKDSIISKRLESKLYHSEFYYQKLVYDSFALIFKLENYNNLAISSPTSYYDMKFKVTSSLKSRFLFEIPLLSENYNYIRTIDYEGIMIANRNNEIPLYNSAYLNYIRSAYNYDVKAKERQQASAWISAGSSLINTSMAVATSPTPTGAISGATSAIGAISNALMTMESSEHNLEMKLYQSAMQGVNISGSDDVDLYSYYTGNRAKLTTYKLKDHEENLVYNLLFYCGYKCEEFGIPTHNVRNRFDFVQADIDVVLLSGIRDEFINELKSLFNQGVTYIHRYNNYYDFLQEYNNIESIFL